MPHVGERRDRAARVDRVSRTAGPKDGASQNIASHSSYSGIMQLLSMDPPLQLPRKNRKDIHDGWAMVDAGEFAVHILSAEARRRYFENRSSW
jgi:hypothetical protein